jgi:hypothetical protein
MLTNLHSAGIGNWQGIKLLVSDGFSLYDFTDTGDLEPMTAFNNWFHFLSPEPSVGSSATFIRLLKSALLCDPELEQLTVLQDDVELCQNALDYIGRVVIPVSALGASFITWFTCPYDYHWEKIPVQTPHPSELGYPVLAFRPSRYFILAPACTYTRETIDRLLYCPHLQQSWPKRHNCDEMISWALGDSLYATHFPNIAQHRGGKNSAILYDMAKRSHLGEVDTRLSLEKLEEDPQHGSWESPYYVGRSFDALSLIPNLTPKVP